ncbi:MAG: M4 family metallopeptidase [Verrucomicrobiales bacterium]|nr:M4 family metallopeptidase [Verrucomicrobiales bacterium]
MHLDPKGNVDLVNGAYIPTPAEVPAKAKIGTDEAKQAAIKAKPEIALGRFTEPELIIHGPLDRAAGLAWRLEVHVSLISAWRFVIDALDGSLRAQTSLVHDAAVTGGGPDGNGTPRTLNMWQEGGTFYMVDTSKQMFDATSLPPNNGRGTIEIYDAAAKEVQDTQFSAGLMQSANLNSGWDGDAVGAAYGLSETYDYYLERFGRNSLNGAGGTIRALVRYGNNVANAFWYGTTKTMVFGFGFTRQIDISGHELTHGVIDSVGNGGILEYENQPGALNEALADIFGEMVEARNKNARPDWLKADPFDPTNRDKLLQDYANPTSVSQLRGRANPSKMSEFVQLTINEDHGGVHINSSIINHCFFLLAEGIEGALGLPDAEKIFYRAMTTQLQKQSQFIDMRLGCVIAAEELFGKDSTQARKTREAFDRVEILDAPSTPDPTPIPTVNAPDSVLFLRVFSDPFFGQGVILCRREQALGDPVTGVLLHNDFVSPRRISVSGDSSFAVFVTVDNDIGIIRTDNGAVSFADLTGTVHSIAMAPSGTRFAVVLRDAFTGTPEDEIVLVDLARQTEENVKLLAPVADGTAQDIVKFADSMDFFPDGNTLIYDALSEIPAAGRGSFEGWTLFSMDLTTKRISTLINLNEGLDFGNPGLGNGRNYLLTYEVVDKRTGVSTIFASDLRSGDVKPIGTLTQGNVVGFPAYTGDDQAVIYTQVDLSVPTTVSLVRQELADDGITPEGQPTLWLADADYAAIYRRGMFVAENALPQVAITAPAPGQRFPLPANITVSANASDQDGTIAKVEFYVGSTLVTEDTTPPYSASLTVESSPASILLLTVRAIDNLGGASDSAPVEVKLGSVTPPPIVIETQPQSQTVQEGGTATFVAAASGGQGPLTYQWRRNGVDLGITSATLQLSNVALGAAGDYTVIVSDGAATVTSAIAKLAVTPLIPQPGEVRLQGKALAGGFVQLTVTGGKLNDVFRIQASQDLKNWTTITTLVKTGEVVSTIDADSATFRARFYRAEIGN